MSDYAMLIRLTRGTPPHPALSRQGRGVKSMSSPLMGEDEGEGGEAGCPVGWVSRRRNPTICKSVGLRKANPTYSIKIRHIFYKV